MLVHNSRVSGSREHCEHRSENEMLNFFSTFRHSINACTNDSNFYSGSKFLLEILFISSQKNLRIIICMHSGEQKSQNGLEKQMISKLYLESRKIFQTACTTLGQGGCPQCLGQKNGYTTKPGRGRVCTLGSAGISGPAPNWGHMKATDHSRKLSSVLGCWAKKIGSCDSIFSLVNWKFHIHVSL